MSLSRSSTPGRRVKLTPLAKGVGLAPEIEVRGLVEVEQLAPRVHAGEAHAALQVGADPGAVVEEPPGEDVGVEPSEVLLVLVGRLHDHGPELESAAEPPRPRALRDVDVEVDRLLQELAVGAARRARPERRLKDPLPRRPGFRLLPPDDGGRGQGDESEGADHEGDSRAHVESFSWVSSNRSRLRSSVSAAPCGFEPGRRAGAPA